MAGKKAGEDFGFFVCLFIFTTLTPALKEFHYLYELVGSLKVKTHTKDQLLTEKHSTH